jgi:energy-coupling factor transporter ATP-binding protein EcfA2
MPRLKRLTIRKFPRVKPGTELVFNEGTNVLLGINGSGKTTLLKLLSMVCSGTFAGLERVDFHLGYEFEHDGITYAAELKYDAPRRFQSEWGSDEELMRSSSPPSAAKFTASVEIRRPGEAPIRLDIEDGQGRVQQGERSSELGAMPSLFEYSFISAALLAIFNSAGTKVTTPDGLFGVDAFPVSRLDESTQWLEESLRVGEFEIRERPTGPLATAGTRTAGSVRQAALARFLAGERRPLVLEKSELEFLAETGSRSGP